MMTISAWRQKLQSGEISARELVDLHLQRLEACEPSLNTYVEATAGKARADADRIDQARASGEALGPLAGIPLAIKDNRKLMSLEHSEQYLKASLEDSNNKQAEQVTSLKEELEKLNGKLSSAKVATAATKWKLKAAHEAEKKAQMSRSTAAAQEAEQAWAAERDKLEARIVQLTAGSTTMKEAEQAADAAAAAKANPKKEKEGPETGKDKEEDKENAKAKK